MILWLWGLRSDEWRERVDINSKLELLPGWQWWRAIYIYTTIIYLFIYFIFFNPFPLFNRKLTSFLSYTWSDIRSLLFFQKQKLRKVIHVWDRMYWRWWSYNITTYICLVPMLSLFILSFSFFVPFFFFFFCLISWCRVVFNPTGLSIISYLRFLTSNRGKLDEVGNLIHRLIDLTIRS